MSQRHVFQIDASPWLPAITLLFLASCTPGDTIAPPGYTGPDNPLTIAIYNAQQHARRQQAMQEDETYMVGNGFSSDQAAAWENAGFSGSVARGWFLSGVTDPNVALQWISLVYPNNQSLLEDYAPSWLQNLTSHNITPDDAKPYFEYMQSSEPGYNGDGLDQIILAAQSYRANGLSVGQAIYYSSNNISYNEIPAFNKKKALYDEEKSTITRQCGGNISSNDITQMSPYSIQGQCFQIGFTQVSQWVDQNSALVSNFGLYLDFPSSQQTNAFNNIIVVGEAPYSYQATSGAQLTVPRAQVLMYLDQSLEIPDPPQ